jgi:hypothetical protein
LLKVLEYRTCSEHENSRQFTRVAAWKTSILAVRPASAFLLAAQLDSPITRTPLLTAQEDLAVVQIPAPPCPQASLTLTMTLSTDPASYWPKAYDMSPFEIIARAKILVSSSNPHNLIRSKMSRPLKGRDLENGYMYAYEVDGNKGYVKIGYTACSITDRHDKWSFDCNRQTKSLYPFLLAAAGSTSDDLAATTAVLVPHARRIEALCHAELDHRRVRIYCGACLKHVEWFYVSAAEVTAVIQKWTRWMATQPYELRQLRNEPKWVLEPTELQKTAGMEQFMRELAMLA